MNSIIADLTARAVLSQTTEGLHSHLEEPRSFFVGFDPTAPSLHIGSLLQLITARRLQLAGHRPVILIGGATGLIGDPKPNAERKLNDEVTVANWVSSLSKQVASFLDFQGPNGALVVNNLDWFDSMSMFDLLRDVGKHFSINSMLQREVVKSRLEEGISFTEFAYILLQSFDFVKLHQEHGVTLQIGGSDQWGNISSGVTLNRKMNRASVHALTTQLLTQEDGTKFGKTERGTIWLDPQLTSPFEFFQFFLNSEDSMVEKLLMSLSLRPLEELQKLLQDHNEKPHLRIAQRALAEELTDFVHGEEELNLILQANELIFGKAAPAEASSAALGLVAQVLEGPEATNPAMPLSRAMVESGLVSSMNEARRALKEGSVRVGGIRASEDRDLTSQDWLAGNILLLHRGKKQAAALTLSEQRG